MQTSTYTKSDGRSIPIAAMHDKHLARAAAILQSHPSRKDELEAVLAEITKRSNNA